ncbi:MAG: peptidoglycan bridge formation glycyltransferase FemA/FemB family protein [Bacilli bacterium]|nr:peptidoglycan bridge formation glycyltransferase FemA/FemB family protein [Bacilli bacterium]MBQ6816814.1 peptidoglycan bridge formation glycyltransferase FemA/FemB family protein [Bacilli bacterium]
MILKEITNEEFTKFALEFPTKSIFQTTGYAFTMNKQHFDSVFLGLVDDSNSIRAASLILIANIKGFKYAYAPRGFLIDYTNKELLKDFTFQIKKFLSRNDIIAIKINPIVIKNIYDKKGNLIATNNNDDIILENLKALGYEHKGFNNYFEAFKPRFEAIIDLKPDLNELFMSCKKALRTKVRRAELNGITIHRGDDRNIKYLYEQLKSTYPRDLKYFQDSYEFYSRNNLIDFYYAKIETPTFLAQSQELYQKQEQLVSELSNTVILEAKNDSSKTLSMKLEADNLLASYKDQLIKATKLLKEHPEGIITACALVIKNGDEAVLLIDSRDKNYSSFNSKHILLWKIICKYASEGYKKFNLGAVSNIKLKPNKYQGLNDFKCNFNPKIYEYLGDFELVAIKSLYLMYQALK